MSARYAIQELEFRKKLTYTAIILGIPLKPMKGLPCLKVDILDQILSFGPVPH